MLYLGLLGALNCEPHHEKVCFSRIHANNKGADRIALSRSFNNASLNLNLNLNSLLVKRQIDNPSPGAVTGGN